jgi:hypothetical protein
MGNTPAAFAPAVGAAPSAPAFEQAGASGSSRQGGGQSAEPPSMYICPITQVRLWQWQYHRNDHCHLCVITSVKGLMIGSALLLMMEL